MSEPTRTRARATAALALCLAAGFVDAVGYVALDHILVSHMSGNTVSVGLHAVDGEWADFFRKLWPIALFVVGLTVSGALHEVGRRRHWPALRFTLLLEVVLLGAFGVLGQPALVQGRYSPPYGVHFYVLVGLGALAMGLQNASLHSTGILTVYTTHITGTITKFGESLVSALFWLHDEHGAAPRRSWGDVLRGAWEQKEVQATLLTGGLWLMFLLGAVAGAALKKRFELLSLALPVALLLAVVAYDAVHPLRPPR